MTTPLRKTKVTSSPSAGLNKPPPETSTRTRPRSTTYYRRSHRRDHATSANIRPARPSAEAVARQYTHTAPRLSAGGSCKHPGNPGPPKARFPVPPTPSPPPPPRARAPRHSALEYHAAHPATHGNHHTGPPSPRPPTPPP